MNMKLNIVLCAGILAALSLADAKAQLPPNFPEVSLWPNTNPAPGDFVGSLTVSNVPTLWSNWFAVLDNAGNPILLSQTNSLGTLACNGLFVSTLGAKGQTIQFALKDDAFNVIATYQGGNGYTADNHDFQVMPNGHVLVECSDNNAVVDMSKLVSGGFPAALPTEFIIQEQDVDGNVVWQWRTLDHIPVTDSYQTLTSRTSGTISMSIPCGSMKTTGRSSFPAGILPKSSRLTGRRGTSYGACKASTINSLSLTAFPETPIPPSSRCSTTPVGGPTATSASSTMVIASIRTLAYNFSRPYSRGVEYTLDEVNKVATMIWEFRHTPDIITYNGGSVQLVGDGHFVITWGGAGNNTLVYQLAMTEADAEGQTWSATWGCPNTAWRAISHALVGPWRAPIPT